MANCVVRYPLYFESLINKIKLNLYIPFSTQKSEVWSEPACGSSVFSSARVSVAPPIPSIGVFPIYPLLYLVASSAVQVGLLLFSLPPAG